MHLRWPIQSTCGLRVCIPDIVHIETHILPILLEVLRAHNGPHDPSTLPYIHGDLMHLLNGVLALIMLFFNSFPYLDDMSFELGRISSERPYM